MPLPAGFYSQDLLKKRQMYMDNQQQERALAARRDAGGALYGMFPEGGQQQQPQGRMPPPGPMLQPPPPQQGGPSPAPPPGTLSPGGGNPAVMQPPPQQQQPGLGPTAGGPPPQMMMAPPQQAAPAAPPAPPPQIAPFRPLPAAPQGQGADAVIGADIPPPPAAGGAPGQPQGGKQFDLKSLVGGLRKAGIPGERVMDMLEQLAPVMNSMNRQELDALKVQTGAERAANTAYKDFIARQTKAKEFELKQERERRMQGESEHKKKLMDARAEAAVGGANNISKKEYIYPKNEQGQVDQTQAPIGIRAVTKKGRILNLDTEGRVVPTLAGATAAEAKASTVNVKDTVRGNLVEGSAFNAMNRLKEIREKYPEGTTSILFGQSADNPISRGAAGAWRGTQTDADQDLDAKWASFIDEAIPVFTGGLRGSDAFRKFLIEQAPGPGTKPSVVAEKMRLFEENIKGTQKAFANKFKSDPAMWGPGEKPGENPGGKPGALPKGIPAGAKLIGKTPEGKDVYQAGGKNYTAD